MNSLGRWAAGSLQALAVPLLAFASFACAPANHGRPPPTLPRVPPDTIAIRTERFTFTMGKAVDPTWPTKAEETRDALGGELEALMLNEDTVVPVLARQLGVTWPEEPLDFDVALGDRPDGAGSTACATGLGRLVVVADRRVAKPRPTVFFACILDRALAQLEGKSTLHRGLVDARPKDGERLYACVRRFAVSVVVQNRDTDGGEARVVDAGVKESCTPEEAKWLARAWLKRVREEDSPMDFALRMAEEAKKGVPE